MENLPMNEYHDTNNYPKVIVCIPAYNEANYIGDIIQKSKNYADEVIVCDDGSSDNTITVAKDAEAIIIKHAKNSGYGRSIRSLFRTALERKADIIVTIDSDGQHNPEQIPDILQPIIKDGFDIVIGSRFLEGKHKSKVPFYRRVGIKTISRLTKQASYKTITDAQSGFRAYSRGALQRINLVEDGMSISTEILFKAEAKNLTITEVPITINYDVDKPSTHNFLSHGISLLFNVLQFISLRHPMIFYGLPGIALLVVSGIFAQNALTLFSDTRFISINMILLSTTTAIIGIVLLTTGIILFSIAGMFIERTKVSVLFTILQFISLRHPMIFYGLPGIALLVVSGIFAYAALDNFSSSRYVTIQLTNMLFVMAGTATIGIVLLATGSILFTVAAMLKGRVSVDLQ
jgi:glycosyltransferase involved in cell wall biosynthesis